jgi:hypothetical protein
MYQKQGHRDEAESLLQSAFDVLARTQGADVKSTRAVVNELADLYETWGKAIKAAEWRAKLPKEPSPKR